MKNLAFLNKELCELGIVKTSITEIKKMLKKKDILYITRDDEKNVSVNKEKSLTDIGEIFTVDKAYAFVRKYNLIGAELVNELPF